MLTVLPPPPAPPAPSERRNDWRGGIVLSCAIIPGSGGAFAELWTVDPRDGSERVIPIHAQGADLPKPGDQAAWNYGHSPGWWPKGAFGRRCFLPRAGASFDPATRTPRTAKL